MLMWLQMIVAAIAVLGSHAAEETCLGKSMPADNAATDVRSNLFFQTRRAGRVATAKDATAMREADAKAIAEVRHEVAAHSDVLYIVRTCDANKDTRLKAVFDTWAAQLEKEALLVVGDSDSESPKVFGATGCAGDHWTGLTCKTGHALALAAAGKIGSRPWAFVIDDDVYVNTTNLEIALNGHNASSLEAFGIPGCGPHKCDDGKGGFCGGGGYAISRASLQAIAASEAAADVHSDLRGTLLKMAAEVYPAYGAYSPPPCDDIITSCLMKRKHISLEQLDGLYGWRIDNPSQFGPNPADKGALDQRYKHAIHLTVPRPLTFHYVSPAEMYAIHDEFAKPGNKELALISFGEVLSYEEQLRRHLHAHQVI